MQISCREVIPELSNYLDQDLDPVLRYRLTGHFFHCRRCASLLDGLRNLLRLVADGQAFPPPDGFGQRLYSKIPAEPGARN